MKKTIRTVVGARTTIRKYVNRQQLPHLCWLLIIIATNCFCLCSTNPNTGSSTGTSASASASASASITRAINSNGNSNHQSRTMKPILQPATTSHNNANFTTIPTLPTATNAANAFDTETLVHFVATRQVWGGGEIKEIENKPVEMNENVYVQKNRNRNKNTTAPWIGLSEKFITWPNATTTTTTTTTNVEWLNLTDVTNNNDYPTAAKASPPDQTASGSIFSTTLSFNHSDRNSYTFHEDCLANSNTLSHLCTIVLYSAVCVVGLFGNTLVIWVVLRFSKMQTVTNIYILNLAIADECFLIGIPFLLYTMRICSWKFGDYMCKAYMVSTSITQFTSSIFLLIMAADRYIAVCHPIESPKYRTLRIAKLVSILAWLTSAVLMLPVILFASTVRQEDGQHFSCNIDWPEVYKKHSGATFILYTFLLGFATPLCFILVFYYLVIRKLHSVQQKHKSKEKKRSHRKVTRLVLTVITVYILCWLPHWISQVSLISAFVGQRELSRFEILLFLLFGCLAYSNSAMNPILYAFLSDNFRKSFTRAFTCINRHDVEVELINEHSAVTQRRTASGNKRRNSRHLTAPKTATAIQNNSCFLAPTTVHNSGGGGFSSGATSTSTSTATTATDKSSNISKQTNEHLNGEVVVALGANTDEERIHMVVSHDRRSHGFKTALCQVETQNQTDV